MAGLAPADRAASTAEDALDNVWFLAAIWVGLALLATLFAIWFRISTALSEIVVGTVAQLIIGVIVGPTALGSSSAWIAFLAATGAAKVMRGELDRWRRVEEPRAETLYREAVERFVEMTDDVRAALAASGVDGVAPLDSALGFRVKSRLHYTEMLHLAPLSLGARLLDTLGVPGRRRSIERAAARYLGRLFEVNSARITNDFRERVLESRRLLDAELRSRLTEVRTSAERALTGAREARHAGAAAVSARLAWLAGLRAQLDEIERD